MNPIGVGVWTYGMGTDRYVSGGYKDPIPLRERLRRIGAQKGVSAVEITYPGDMDETTYAQYRPLLEELGLRICAVGVELVCDRSWRTGSFTSPSAGIRERSVRLVERAMDFAASVGCGVVNLWLGQDGFDYLFQTDYVLAWERLTAGLRTCAEYNGAVRLGLEYKPSEPRLKCLVDSAGTALSLCQCVGAENVGVTMDVGHSLMAKENPAQTAAVLMAQKRLFHLHLNDNYLLADDDMPVGSVHFLQFLELFFWLKRCGYDGWYSLDMYPYRDDPDAAVRSSVKFIRNAERLTEERLSGLGFAESEDAVPGDGLNGLFDRLFGADARPI